MLFTALYLSNISKINVTANKQNMFTLQFLDKKHKAPCKSWHVKVVYDNNAFIYQMINTHTHTPTHKKQNKK